MFTKNMLEQLKFLDKRWVKMTKDVRYTKPR